MAGVSDVLRDLRTLFEERGINWYVFGAQAVVVFGRPRQTLDVDVTIDLSVDQVSSLAAELEKSGFSMRVDDVDVFVRRTHVLPIAHVSSGIPVDVILAGPGLEQEFLERSVMIAIENRDVPFISPEDLIAGKILAGRPKDLDDVRGILDKSGDSLDEARIRDVLQRLEEALDESDLLERFKSLRR